MLALKFTLHHFSDRIKGRTRNTYSSREFDGGGHHDLSGRDLDAIEGNGKKTGRHCAEMCGWRIDYSVMIKERADWP